VSRGNRHRPTDFDAIADTYDTSLPVHVVEHYLRKRVSFIREHVPLGLALDVGCGTGTLAVRLAAAGYQVVGLDPSRNMLARPRRSGITVVAGTGTSLPFRDGTFALTYCVAMLHHVADPTAVRRTLTEMARVTHPGGHILVWDHNPLNPYWRFLMRRVPQDTGAERLIPTDELLGGLRAGGARPVTVRRSGLVPDFMPPRLLGTAQAAERLAEAAPLINKLCAHNVVLAVKEHAAPG